MPDTGDDGESWCHRLPFESQQLENLDSCKRGNAPIYTTDCPAHALASRQFKHLPWMDHGGLQVIDLLHEKNVIAHVIPLGCVRRNDIPHVFPLCHSDGGIRHCALRARSRARRSREEPTEGETRDQERGDEERDDHASTSSKAEANTISKSWSECRRSTHFRIPVRSELERVYDPMFENVKTRSNKCLERWLDTPTLEVPLQ